MSPPRLLPLVILAMTAAGSAAAQEPDQFNLECREFRDPDTLLETADHEFSVDLATMTVCRRNNPRCATVVRHGRFLEFSYRFQNQGHEHEVFRLYDPETGWLTQIMRMDGNVGRSYGDAVCKVRPFRQIEPALAAASG